MAATKSKTLFKVRVPLAAPLANGENGVNVEVYYSKGGMNYFSGGSEPRGYWLRVHATKIGPSFPGDTRMSESFLIGAGIGTRLLLAPADRLNGKTLAALAAKVLSTATALAMALSAGDKDTIASTARAAALTEAA